MAQNIIYSPWERTQGPWLCLMTTLLWFSLLCMFSFVSTFPTSLIKLAAKSLQLCPTLCDPIEGSPPGFPVPGILQARTLEWVAIAFSNAWKWKVKEKSSVASDSLRPHGLQPTRLLHPWGFPGKSTGVGWHCLLCLLFLLFLIFWPFQVLSLKEREITKEA